MTQETLRVEWEDPITEVRHQIKVQAVSNHGQGSEEITTRHELTPLESALAELT